MKTQNGYRFSLSFPAATPEQKQVGELLEALGSKKSRFVVQVLADYLRWQAETQPAEPVRPAFRPRPITQARVTPSPTAPVAEPAHASNTVGSGIESMLGNMELFE